MMVIYLLIILAKISNIFQSNVFFLKILLFVRKFSEVFCFFILFFEIFAE